MKMIITEKQLSTILKKNKEIKEAESLTSPSTSNTTMNSPSSSPTSGGGTGENTAVNTPERPDGVPEMQKWESGVTRGVANPAGTVKKREDYPEAEPKRGKANPLR